MTDLELFPVSKSSDDLAAFMHAASRAGYQPYWICWAYSLGKRCEDETLINGDFMAWMNEKHTAFRRHKGVGPMERWASYDTDFLEWLKKEVTK